MDTPKSDKELLAVVVELRSRLKMVLESGQYSGMAHYALVYLDLIAKILREGSSHPYYSQEERGKIVRAIGKSVLYDHSFSESPIGKELFDIGDAFYADKR